MPLTDKYLKYKPEITFEIFEKVWNKLIECGWKHDTNLKTEYSYFKNNWHYLKQNVSYKKFGAHSTPNSEQTETTVEEILGYDPFVKTRQLISFPESGYCVTRSFELIDYLEKKFQTISKQMTKNDTIIAWNTGGFWFCKEKSNKDLYTLEELLPFIKPENQAVHCTTQEEWNFVLSKFNPQNLLNAYFNTKPGIMTKIPVNTICISYSGLRYDSNIGTCGDVSCFKDYQILSFKEWCDQNGYKMEKDWTKASKEELLDEAKRRYPIGTRFISAINSSHKDIVTNNYYNFYNYDVNEIVVNKNTGSSIYKNGKWAEIVSLLEEKSEEKPKFEVGKWYKVKYVADNSEYYLKYINNEYEFGYSEYIEIKSKNHSKFKSGNDLHNMTTPVLVDLSEIQQYLPDDHPDKIKSCVPPSELKVGMWVKITKSDDNWTYSMDKFISQIVQITEVIDNDRIRFENDGNWYWRYSNKHFEIIETDCSIDSPCVPPVRYDIETCGYVNTDGFWTNNYSEIITKNQIINDPTLFTYISANGLNPLKRVTKGQTVHEACEQLINQSKSIFPKFEVPEINIKEEVINNNYFKDFKDPYINK